jgi:phage-related protein
LTLDKKVKSAEIVLFRFIARHNVAIDIMDEMPEILKTCFPDVAKNVTCFRTKTAHLVNNVIGEVGFEDLCEFIKKQKFSIIFDEKKADMSNKKNLVIVVRHLDLNAADQEDSFSARDSFLRHIEVEQCTDEDITGP